MVPNCQLSSEFLQYPLCVPQYLSQKRANKAEWILLGHSWPFFRIATIPHCTLCTNPTIPHRTILYLDKLSVRTHTIPHTIQFPTLPDQFGPNRMDPSRPFTVIFLRPPLTLRAFYNSLGSSTVTKRNVAEGQGRKNDKETVVEYVGLETTLLMIGQTGASHRSLLSDGRT